MTHLPLVPTTSTKPETMQLPRGGSVRTTFHDRARVLAKTASVTGTSLSCVSTTGSRGEPTVLPLEIEEPLGILDVGEVMALRCEASPGRTVASSALSLAGPTVPSLLRCPVFS